VEIGRRFGVIRVREADLHVRDVVAGRRTVQKLAREPVDHRRGRIQGVGLAKAVFGQAIIGENPGDGSEIPLVDEPGVGVQNLGESGSVGEPADGDVDVNGHGSSWCCSCHRG
jgi:hypothetical protein